MKKKAQISDLPSKSDTEKFDMLFPMITSDLAEIRELSKKKQDEPLNAFKVKTLNKKLMQIKELLNNQPTIEFIELLDEDSLPTNSDAVLLISQYINAMELFKAKYFVRNEGDGWHIDPKWRTND